MSALQTLEAKLDDILVRQAPPLPSNARKIIVKYLPYVNLVLGIATLLVALGLYRTAHTVNSWVDSLNNLSVTYGNGEVAADHLTTGVWLALAVLAVEALLFVAAYPGTRDRKKSGWDLLFYGLLINVVYGVVLLFTDYGGVGRLLGSLLGSGVGLYLLFQIRGSYRGAKPRSRATRVAGSAKKS